ncbi:MAG TPA: ferritin-like domain-containing protein [Vicinamibacterales bacterium]|nr:ferritin-like domain-containing protein [Vicinamibacterales bacterium]
MIDRELLVAWLNDAYAMEHALVPVLEHHAKDAGDDAEVRSRLELHVEQTRRHAELVEGCLERLGSGTSTLKKGTASVFGTLQSLATGMFRDEAIKNALSDYATEHFEIACYRALAEAARQAGESDIVEVCEEIRRDEEEMARWLEERIPAIVQQAAAGRGA